MRTWFAFSGTEEKAKCMGPKPRFIFCSEESFPGVKVGQWAKTRGPDYIEEDEPVE